MSPNGGSTKLERGRGEKEGVMDSKNRYSLYGEVMIREKVQNGKQRQISTAFKSRVVLEMLSGEKGLDAGQPGIWY